MVDETINVCSPVFIFLELGIQAECDELSQRAEALKEENANLRSELKRIRADYEQLMEENSALKVLCQSHIWTILFFI